ncbi:MAG TPA: helix-turn-helix domain-containing protein [Candidatus Eisenbacteria bacterium]
MTTRHPSSAPLRARLRQEIHAAILDAAESVFAREGLALGRMERVAQEAGVAVGTLYNYFKDRSALLASLLDSRRVELLDRLDAALAAAEPAFGPQLDAFLGSVLDHAREHRSLLAILMQEEITAAKARLAPPPGERTWDQLLIRARRVVARGVSEGALRHRDADLWPGFFLASLREALRRELADRDGGPAADTAKTIRTFFLNGAGRRADA